MNRKWALGIGIPLALVGLLALGAYAWIRTPVETESYDDPVSAETTEQNTALRAALLAGGLEHAFVDVTPEQAYVAYEPPADSATSATDWQWFVLGAAADAVQGTAKVIVVQYDGDAPMRSWSVPFDSLQAFASGDMGADAFEKRIEKRTF